jgi:hypothetical protein
MNTCPSRRPRKAAVARAAIASAPFSLPLRFAQSVKFMKPWPVFWPLGPPPPPPPATTNIVRTFLLLVRAKYSSTALLHLLGAALGRAGGQAHLDAAAPWSSVGRKPVGSLMNSSTISPATICVDQQEDPFAIDDLGHGIGVAVDHALEPMVEPVARAGQPMADLREAAAQPGLVGRLLIHLALEQGGGDRGAQDQATSTDSSIAETMVTENWR